MGIIDTLTLAGAVILATPIAMLGVEFVAEGRLVVGLGFLAVAAALVLGEHYVGLPGVDDGLSRVARAIVKEPPEERGVDGDRGGAGNGNGDDA